MFKFSDTWFGKIWSKASAEVKAEKAAKKAKGISAAGSFFRKAFCLVTRVTSVVLLPAFVFTYALPVVAAYLAGYFGISMESGLFDVLAVWVYPMIAIAIFAAVITALICISLWKWLGRVFVAPVKQEAVKADPPAGKAVFIQENGDASPAKKKARRR